MTRIFFIQLITILLSVCAYSQGKKRAFVINGSVVGFADSTIFYLDELSTGDPVRMDSVYLINGRFRFVGSINSEIRRVVLHTAKFIDSRQFWLENRVIEFSGEKGKFRESVIRGSKTEDEQRELDLAIKTTRKAREQQILFIRNHPHSVLSAFILSSNMPIFGRDTSAVLYKGLSARLKQTAYGKKIADFIRLNRTIKIGDPYVDFTETNVKGKPVRLSDYRGKVVLLEFWGSWCFPCRAGNPELIKIYNEFKEKGFEILGVAAETERSPWIEAVQKDSLPWENVSDVKGMEDRAIIIYGVYYFPSSFLIDRNGIIIARDLRDEALRKKLREVFD
jgi:peroxiredoxin